MKPSRLRRSQWANPAFPIRLSALAAGLASALNAGAQSIPGSTNTLDPAALTQLLQRIDQLEQKAKRVDALEAEVKSLKAGAGSVAAEPEVSTREVWPKIDFQVQGDVDFHVSGNKSDKNTFFLGDFTPLITAKLSDQAQVVADFAVESDQMAGDGFNVDIERLYAEYDVNDYFNVVGGRFNTDIGYYNSVYHNGTYFQTTVDRPGIFDFEDDGGILPDHMTGLSINGAIPSGSLNLHYTAEIGNGRNYDLNQPAFFISDNNDFKAYNLALYAKPDWLSGLQFGGSAYYDTVTTPGVPRTDQLILSGYGVYKTGKFEWLTEGIYMCDTPAGGSAHWTSAGYTQVSRKFGQFRPYFRMEWRNTPAGDPLMAYIGQNVCVWGPTVGVRWDFTQMMAIKLEYEHVEQNNINSSDQVTIQWTFRY